MKIIGLQFKTVSLILVGFFFIQHSIATEQGEKQGIVELPTDCKPALWRRIGGAVADKLLGIRYQQRVQGLDEIAANGTGGILFLNNHSAAVETLTLRGLLRDKFNPRAIMNGEVATYTALKPLVTLGRALPLPSVKDKSRKSSKQLGAAIDEIVAGLKRGENFFMYPSGILQESRYEEFNGASAVERILALYPETRIVLVRNNGFWGSHFSRAYDAPYIGDTNWLQAGKKMTGALLGNGVVFTPKRPIHYDFTEPVDFPKTPDRLAINQYLTSFYRGEKDAFNPAPAIYVPLTIWEKQGVRRMPEPKRRKLVGDLTQVPDSVKDRVIAVIEEEFKISKEKLKVEAELGNELGLDSLDFTKLMITIESEFGASIQNPELIRTVGDVMLIANGQKGSDVAVKNDPHVGDTVDLRWLSGANSKKLLEIPEGKTIPEIFLKNAAQNPNKVIIADDISGPLTYQDIITRIYALKPHIEKITGDRVGIMLPASAGAAIVYLAAQFAGKTPVFINFTVGPANLEHIIKTAGISKILTSEKFLTKLTDKGTDLTPIDSALLPLEEIGEKISLIDKAKAALMAKMNWGPLRNAKFPEVSAILYTSGSEAAPKGVPLTHANQIANLKGVLDFVPFVEGDSQLSMLPPFHSFGFTVGIVAPLVMGAKTYYTPDPTRVKTINKTIEKYGITWFPATPTFLNGIIKGGTAQALKSLRIVVTGAEKLNDDVRLGATNMIPNLSVLEGYGITECSPVVCANLYSDNRPGSIGKVLPNVQYAVVDLSTNEAIPAGDERQGKLLVRGPSIFEGYLPGTADKDPFIEWKGEKWYDTADLVTQDTEGFLYYKGRLKRFIKKGGEMLSLPQIESVLSKSFPATDEGPAIAVETAETTDGKPQLVAFVTTATERSTLNDLITKGGLTNLFKMDYVVLIPKIPMLGTGKTDYRSLKDLAKDEVARQEASSGKKNRSAPASLEAGAVQAEVSP